MRKQQHKPIRLDKYLGQCWNLLPVELRVFATHFNFSSVDKICNHEIPSNQNETNKLAIMKNAIVRQQKIVSDLKNTQSVNIKTQLLHHDGQNVDTNQNMAIQEAKIQQYQQVEQNQMSQPILLAQENWYLQSEDSINFFLS